MALRSIFYRVKSPQGAWQREVVDVTTPPVTITGLTAGVTYEVDVGVGTLADRTPSSDFILTSLSYTRGTAGVAPTIATTTTGGGSLTGDFTFWGVFAPTALNKEQIDASANKFSVTEASLAALETIDVDAPNSVTNGVLSGYIVDSLGVASSVATDTSNVSYDGAAPILSGAEVGSIDATSLIVTFDKAVYGSTSTADWVVTVNGVGAGLAAASLSGSTADITLNAAVTAGQTVTVAYSGSGIVGVDAEVVEAFSAPVSTGFPAGFGYSESVTSVDTFSTDGTVQKVVSAPSHIALAGDPVTGGGLYEFSTSQLGTGPIILYPGEVTMASLTAGTPVTLVHAPWSAGIGTIVTEYRVFLGETQVATSLPYTVPGGTAAGSIVRVDARVTDDTGTTTRVMRAFTIEAAAGGFTDYNIVNYGAVNSSTVDSGAAIQAAIDAAAAASNGQPGHRVIIPAGTYRSNRALFLRRDNQHIVIQGTLLKGYVSGAAFAFIRPTDQTRGLNDPTRNITNGLLNLRNVIIEGGGTIRMASKNLTPSAQGSYGPHLLTSGSGWRVRNITFDGYYATPRIVNGNLEWNSNPPPYYNIASGDLNAICIQVVGDNHEFRNLNLLDGSHSAGTTGIRVFSGSNIYVTDCYIESGDDMVACAGVPKYTIVNNVRTLSTSPLNQGPINGVHFNNITGFSSMARVMASIDGQAFRGSEIWGIPATNITCTNFDAFGYKGNQGITCTNDTGSVEARIGRINFVNCILRSANLPSDTYSYDPNPVAPYTNTRAFVFSNIPQLFMKNCQVIGTVTVGMAVSNMTNAQGLTGAGTIDLYYTNESATQIYRRVNGGTGSGNLAAAQAYEASMYFHPTYLAEN